MFSIFSRKQALFGVVAATVMAMTPLAQAGISFSVTAASLTPDSGYGVDVGHNPENGGTLLDVLFVNTFTAPVNFDLAVGQPFTFNVGTITLQESDTGNGRGNLGIRNGELDALSVFSTFTFGYPLGTVSVTMTATGTATTGPVSDPEVDYTLNWTPLVVDFGFDGQFEIVLADLSFSNNLGFQTETATIRLLALPGQDSTQLRVTAQASTVPEPSSLILMGVGLIGMYIVRRRKAGLISWINPRSKSACCWVSCD